ncbi:M3 family metallopeptidase [Flavobacterium nitrogenifigens]|uniref:Peptidyl-dipeptidase Dcp Metallo peptidase. MEROPS family M03A n=1 Tax=Flavobacterium nitrogenifigens TaxID=1617283 RepID=A0A521C5Q5_9FLAO|nr:M3 family metallopeptidase [Flavobacterium nitrogenifigens]KAF2326915.1 M3 family metallopeptidase [Flavobacterium nitrogenifigens]SMO54752.1 peptidyl-dipeptidase Dcp Metallo peptidase. MEROPS family M03A [Flavobacterium nitrogenifigens]
MKTPIEIENSLLRDWSGPYGGVPDFTVYKVSDFKPAIKFAIQEKLEEIDSIANNPEKPTFKNTIEALELSGEKLDRIHAIYGIYRSNLSTAEFNAVDTEMSPKLAEINDKLYQNEKLFSRIEALYKSDEKNNLTKEQQRLLWLYYTDFVREGAELKVQDKEKVAKINQELATLFTSFSQKLLAEENDQYIELKTEADFDGLPEEFKNAAIAEANERNLNVLGCIGNTRSSIEPFLTFSNKRSLRQEAFDIFVKRGDNKNENDTNETLVSILKLRAEKAKILGFKNFAEWSLSNKMAKDPQKTLDLMHSVWKPAVEKVKNDVSAMQEMVNKEGGNFRIHPWDYRYYAEKVRKALYDLDQNEIKQYLQLENLREGMFWTAGELFNLGFKQLFDVPVYHPDVRVWEVNNKNTGEAIGLWYFDPYARTGKRSGAWMNSHRDQQKIKGNVLPIVSNNCNFIKGNRGEPVLISWDDATTLFHEFGHALHGLCSNVTYPSLSGTSVARDYVEFPSQLLEHWLATPEVLNKFALHYKTNEPLSQSLVERIGKAANFNEGFATVETISSSFVDMKLHLTTETIDPQAFEAQVLNEINMPSEIVMRHRIPQFAHIFSSDGYAAGYYSYLWADVINADAYEAFLEADGPFDKNVSERLYETVLSVGNTIDNEEMYENFRGHAPQSDALMRARNFPVES